MAQQQGKIIGYDPSTGKAVYNTASTDDIQGYDPNTGLAVRRPGLSPVASHRPDGGSLLDKLQAILAMAPSTSAMAGGLGAVRHAVADPENRSSFGGALGGMAGGAAGGALVGGPFGIIGGGILGALAGGTGGSLAEGKSWGPALQEGALEATFQGVPALGGQVLGRGALGLARSASKTALHPARQILDSMINPATGQQYSTPGRARRAFGARAVDNLDEFRGHPGGNRYAEGSIAKDESNRALKVDALRRTDAVGKTLSDDDLVPQGTFDKLLARMSERDGTAVTGQLGVDAAVKQALARSHIIPGAQRNLTGGRPILAGGAGPGRPWGFAEADQRIGGIQDTLDKIFDANQKAQMVGGPLQNSAEEDALKLIRSSMSRAVAGGSLPAQGGRTVPQLNRAIQHNIPVTQAAIDATMPAGGENMPRMRLAGSPTQPGNFQLFNYLGRSAAGLSARPLNVTSKGLRSPTVGTAVSPQLLRLLDQMYRRD